MASQYSLQFNVFASELNWNSEPVTQGNLSNMESSKKNLKFIKTLSMFWKCFETRLNSKIASEAEAAADVPPVLRQDTELPG